MLEGSRLILDVIERGSALTKDSGLMLGVVFHGSFLTLDCPACADDEGTEELLPKAGGGGRLFCCMPDIRPNALFEDPGCVLDELVD